MEAGTRRLFEPINRTRKGNNQTIQALSMTLHDGSNKGNSQKKSDNRPLSFVHESKETMNVS